LPELYSSLDLFSLIFSKIPRKSYNRISRRVQMPFECTEMLQLEKRPEPVQESGRVLPFC
jgi:hypothetical protein